MATETVYLDGNTWSTVNLTATGTPGGANDWDYIDDTAGDGDYLAATDVDATTTLGTASFTDPSGNLQNNQVFKARLRVTKNAPQSVAYTIADSGGTVSSGSVSVTSTSFAEYTIATIADTSFNDATGASVTLQLTGGVDGGPPGGRWAWEVSSVWWEVEYTPPSVTISTSLSGYKRAEDQTSTTSLSSYLRQEDNTRTATLTAYLQELVTLTADLDAYLQALGQSSVTSLTAYLEQTAELATSLTAHLSAGGTETLTTALDAYLQATGQARSVDLSALLQALQTKTTTLSGFLKATGQTQTTTISAYLQQLRTLTTTLTAYLQATDQQRQTSLTAHLIAAGAVLLTTGLDAYLKATGQQQTTALSGYLRQTGNLITSALSAFLGLTSGLAASVTAYLKALGVEVAASLSATLQAASGSTVGLGYSDLTAQCESATVTVASSSAVINEFGGADE